MISTYVRESSLWTSWRERRQRARFEALSQSLQNAIDNRVPLNVSDGSVLPPPTRLPIKALDDRSRIIGFGAATWERFGLWPAFERLCDFSLWDHTREVPEKNHDGAYRSLVEKTFLAYVDELARRSAVDCVFFYAAGTHISSGLLSELRQRGISTIILGLDDKHQLSASSRPAVLSDQLRVALGCDLYWTTWELAADAINCSGGSAWFSPPGADPHFFTPSSRAKDIDLLFIGSRYGHRGRLIDYLRQRNISVRAYGSGWANASPGFDEMSDLIARAKIVLGHGGVGYMSDVKHLKGRDFEVPMAGKAYLTTYNPELSKCFAIGDEILCYDSFAECAELAQHLLRTNADVIGERARDRSVRSHTWDARVRALFARSSE